MNRDGNIFKNISLTYGINMRYLFILYILFIFTGCDNIKCSPDGRLEDKKGNWFIGGKCGGKW